MHSFYGTRLSENMAKTPEGYLICYDVNIARIGSQDYLGSELGTDDDVISVNRPADEVFKPSTVASFEGKPFTNEHPYKLLDVNDTSIYEKGHVQNVRVSDDKTYLVADIMVKDVQTIRDIENGKRELSAGYECDCIKDEDGNWYQCNIIGNHVALVDKGRAGNKVRINDNEWKEQDHPRAKDGKFTSGGGSKGSLNLSSDDKRGIDIALTMFAQEYEKKGNKGTSEASNKIREKVKNGEELTEEDINSIKTALKSANSKEADKIAEKLTRSKQEKNESSESSTKTSSNHEEKEPKTYQEKLEQAKIRSFKQSGDFDEDYEADLDEIVSTLKSELKNPKDKDIKYAISQITSGYNDNLHIERAIMSMDDAGLFVSNDIGTLNKVQKALKQLGIETVWREQEVGKAFMSSAPIFEKRLFFNGNENYLEKKSVDFNDNDIKKEKQMKDKNTVLGKLLKAFARDAQPEEMVEAIKAVKGEDEVPETSRIDEIEAKLAELSAKFEKLYEAEKKEEQGEMHALDELEKEITDGCQVEDEEKEEIKDEDAKNDPKLIEAISEKAQNDEDTTEEIKKEIADAKKVIAKIEDVATRKAVADSLAKIIRGKMTSNFNYKKLMDASKQQPTEKKGIDYDEAFAKIKENNFRK